MKNSTIAKIELEALELNYELKKTLKMFFYCDERNRRLFEIANRALELQYETVGSDTPEGSALYVELGRIARYAQNLRVEFNFEEIERHEKIDQHQEQATEAANNGDKEKFEYHQNKLKGFLK